MAIYGELESEHDIQRGNSILFSAILDVADDHVHRHSQDGQRSSIRDALCIEVPGGYSFSTGYPNQRWNYLNVLSIFSNDDGFLVFTRGRFENSEGWGRHDGIFISHRSRHGASFYVRKIIYQPRLDSHRARILHHTALNRCVRCIWNCRSAWRNLPGVTEKANDHQPNVLRWHTVFC